MTAVVSERQGDYEAVKVFGNLTPASFKITASAEAPAKAKKIFQTAKARL